MRTSAKSKICKTIITVLLISLIACCMIFTSIRTTEAATYDVEHDYLTVGKGLLSRNGSWDNWYEIRFYPQNGKSIKRKNVEGNTLYNGDTIDFYPNIKIVTTKVPDNNISNGRKSAVFLYYYYRPTHGDIGVFYENSLTITRNGQGQIYKKTIYGNQFFLKGQVNFLLMVDTKQELVILLIKHTI